jgi:hypothetical protein
MIDRRTALDIDVRRTVVTSRSVANEFPPRFIVQFPPRFIVLGTVKKIMNVRLISQTTWTKSWRAQYSFFRGHHSKWYSLTWSDKEAAQLFHCQNPVYNMACNHDIRESENSREQTFPTFPSHVFILFVEHYLRHIPYFVPHPLSLMIYPLTIHHLNDAYRNMTRLIVYHVKPCTHALHSPNERLSFLLPRITSAAKSSWDLSHTLANLCRILVK